MSMLISNIIVFLSRNTGDYCGFINDLSYIIIIYYYQSLYDKNRAQII